MSQTISPFTGKENYSSMYANDSYVEFTVCQPDYNRKLTITIAYSQHTVDSTYLSISL